MSDTTPTQAPFQRSFYHRMFGGVCSGLAIRNGMSPSVGQLLGILLIILTGGLALVAYIVLWFLLPMEQVDDEVKKKYKRKQSLYAVLIVVVIPAIIITYLVLHS